MLGQWIDVGVVTAYMAWVLVIGIFGRFRIRDIRDFAIGNRNQSTPILVAAIMATLVGGLLTVGLAGQTFSDGIIAILATFGIPISEILIAVLVAPKMKRFFGMISVGDIMGSLYGEKAKILTGLATIFSSIFVLGAQICALGFVFQFFFNLPFALSVLIGAGGIVLYSARGGIKAVTATDAIQFGILIIAIPLVATIGVVNAGGLDTLIRALPESHVSIPFHGENLWKYLGLFLSFTLPALYPVMVQRMLMAKDVKQSQRAFFFKAIISVFIFIVSGLIGLVALVLAPQINSNLAFSYVISSILPSGVKGLAIVGFLAVIMSTADSFLNSISVAFSHDVIKPLAKERLSPEQELMFARTSTVLVGLLSIAAAIWSQDIFKSMLGSMNIWIPFIFPALFLGILGIWTSAKSFWLGLVFAIFSWALSAVFFPSTSLIRAVIAACINSIIIIFLSFNQKHLIAIFDGIQRQFTLDRVRLLLKRTLGYPSQQMQPQGAEYLPFAFFGICNSLAPFFVCSFYGTPLNPPLFVLHLLGALLCFGLFLRDLWPQRVLALWPYYWHASLVLCLPVPGIFITLATKGHPIAVLDALLLFLTLWSFVERRIFFVLATYGTVFAVISLGVTERLHLSTKQSDWYYGVTIIHLLTLLVCLVILQRRNLRAAGSMRLLSGTMAHAFNTPLASFSIEADILQNTLPRLIESYRMANEKGLAIPHLSTKQIQFLQNIPSHIKQNTQRLQSNIQMLMMRMGIKGKPHKLELCSVMRCTQTAMHDFTLLHPDRAELIHMEISGDICFWGRTDIFTLAISELFKNAFEAIAASEQGGISIHIFGLERELHFEDTASGVPEKYIDQLFDEYFTTKKSGSGLGLHFCKMVMQELGGDIRCKSTENKFTRFVLTFPAEQTKWSHENE